MRRTFQRRSCASSRIESISALPASIDTPLFQHAATYMGRKVKPLRPVYDADVVAKAIVRCARKPQRERIVGGAGRMLFQQRMMKPGVFEKMQARMVDRDHFEEAPDAPRSGNVNKPVARTSLTRGVDPAVRAARDLGMAAWFCGTLMGATAVNRAAP